MVKAKRGGAGTEYKEAPPEEKKDGTIVKAWQRMPTQLLHEWAQAQKRPKPCYNKAWAYDKSKCRMKVILPDPKDPAKNLEFEPNRDADVVFNAKEDAAMVALLQVCPTLPLERKLPDGYRETWLEAVGGAAASSGKAAKAKAKAKEKPAAVPEAPRDEQAAAAGEPPPADEAAASGRAAAERERREAQARREEAAARAAEEERLAKEAQHTIRRAGDRLQCKRNGCRFDHPPLQQPGSDAADAGASAGARAAAPRATPGGPLGAVSKHWSRRPTGNARSASPATRGRRRAQQEARHGGGEAHRQHAGARAALAPHAAAAVRGPGPRRRAGRGSPHRPLRALCRAGRPKGGRAYGPRGPDGGHRELRARLAAGTGPPGGRAAGALAAGSPPLHRGRRRVREGRAVAEDLGAVPSGQNGGGRGGAQRHLAYNVVISACGKGEQWQQTLALLSGMREAKMEPDVISYSATISACGEGEQWLRALVLLRELWEAELELDVTSYRAGMFACQKGGQWQRTLSVLNEMRKANLDADFMSYRAGISACQKGGQWQRALSLLSGMREASVIQHCDQHCDQHVKLYNTVIITCGKGEQWQQTLALLGEMQEAKLEPDVISYRAGIVACQEGGQWQHALSALSDMREARVTPGVRPYNAVVSACGKGEQWQRALVLLRKLREAKLEPNVVSYGAGISACGNGDQWQQALSLLGEMWRTKIEPDVISSLQRRDHRLREGRAVVAGLGAAARAAGGEAGAQRHLSQLQRWDQRVRKGRTVAVGSGSPRRDAGGETGA
ncbi:unnamed protein product [Prorocentrum cordatum]|uniref:Pentatricopeptide repeat-containing protein, chloroplastic n=1 Tax=Prorocentrum cordatum TaxID=2364126 RepID=A0ABN9V838_9DINO|nr:unnamed protein product [Polarella glacialis]